MAICSFPHVAARLSFIAHQPGCMRHFDARGVFKGLGTVLVPETVRWKYIESGLCRGTSWWKEFNEQEKEVMCRS